VGVRRTTDFFEVPKWTDVFFTYHGFLTITSLSRIISRDFNSLGLRTNSQIHGSKKSNTPRYAKEIDSALSHFDRIRHLHDVIRRARGFIRFAYNLVRTSKLYYQIKRTTTIFIQN
jgi:hypothetical protein